MERKIGETFEYEGKKLRVEADNDSECKRCYLNEICPDINTKIIGECVNIHRQDKTSVVFVEINDEQPQEQAEQPQKLNLCEILKDCPKWTKFYSTVYGEVAFNKINKECEYPIAFITSSNTNCDVTADGRLYELYYGECTLFPSRDQRDWSKFTAPWLKKERFDPNTLKAFDRVLVRSEKVFNWNCSLFSNIDDSDSKYPFTCLGLCYKFCIPYNDDTKHLIGTADEAPEYYRYWED